MNRKHVALTVAVLVVGLVIVISVLLRNGTETSGTRQDVTIVKESVSDEPEPRPIDIPADAIRFDLKYRGLSYEDGTMQYNFGIGYGMRDSEDTPFLKAVRKRAVDDIRIVYFPGFSAQQYSAVEYKDSVAKKFYFDSNGDGKATDDEISTPINVTERGSTKRCDFVTSDFVATDREGRQYQFRARLQVRFYGEQAKPQCMWSPACVMEGTGLFKGEDTKFVLRVGDMDGRFTRWGRSEFSLMPGNSDGKSVSQAQLSSLIFEDGQFYQLRFQDADDGSLSVVLVEDNTPTGKLDVKLAGKEAVNASMSYARVKGAEDQTIRFTIRNSQAFPADNYVLSSGQFKYGTTGAHDRSVDFTEGPTYAIKAGETSTVVMGNCDMTVSSIDENRRYHPEVKEQAEFDSNMDVFLSLKVRGAGGEVFTRFKKKNGKGWYEEVEPHLTIADAQGKIVASEALEYG